MCEFHVYLIFFVGIWNESKVARPGPYAGTPRVVGKGKKRIEIAEAFRFVYKGKSLPTGNGRCWDCLIQSAWNIFDVGTMKQTVKDVGMDPDVN